MNQSVEFKGAVAGCRTRQDKSLGLTVETPTLTAEEMMLVIQLQDIPCLIKFEPLEGFSVTKEIKTELSKKTQSERIRAVIFCFWHHVGEPGTFDAFYNSETEKYIESIKAKLPPMAG
jgi:4-hydroxy-L-threonine phosphate dehydrogenase PdxA